ncbi:MAG: uroporphyrinogen decarboxylase [Armatimonadetes bacterium]|nr:uroporphyrinogen decarboxylase [Armatimonadota bacterium]
MTRRERVLDAINHKDTDFAPYNIELTHQAHERLTQYVGDPDYIDQIGNHITKAYYDGYLQETEPGSGYWLDHFGVNWNRNGADKDIGVIEGFVLTEPSMKGYSFPELDEQKLRREYEEVIANAGDRCRIAAIGFSMFERAWTLRGMENLLMDMIIDPEFVHELLDGICEHNLKIVNIAMEYPFDGFHFGDDWGQQKGTIMGPKHWQRFIKPRMAKMYERISSAGRFVSQHSCGDIQDLFPDLIEIGLNMYQTFQPEIYDLKSVKREFGKDLTFWGGISTQRALPFVTPDEVKKITHETIAIMSAGGGYIAAPTHDVPFDVPPENIVALVEAFQNQG